MPAGEARDYNCPICLHRTRSDHVRRHVLSKHKKELEKNLPAMWERVSDTIIAKRITNEVSGMILEKDKFPIALCLTCGDVMRQQFNKDPKNYLVHVCHEVVPRPSRKKKETVEAEAAPAPAAPTAEPNYEELWGDVRHAIMNCRPWKGCDKEQLMKSKEAMQATLEQTIDFATEDDKVDYKSVILNTISDIAKSFFIEQQARQTRPKHGGMELP